MFIIIPWKAISYLYLFYSILFELLHAAKKYVKMNKGKIIEGYPVEPKAGKTADVFVWTGLASAFKKAGFKEIKRLSETRPIMRYIL